MLRTESLCWSLGVFHASVRGLSGETYCTAPLTHDEAIKAAQVKKAWSDEALYVRPAQSASATP